MMKKVIQRHTMENEIVIDPFMGSGTTAIACVQMGRRFIGVRQDPKYFKRGGTEVAPPPPGRYVSWAEHRGQPRR